ncbi:polyketide synthase [Mycobacterium bohemicum DSM 44277]|uniref:Polyketide synthase n=2 Tax=Mycobacterium bohemicum TaxID=56425 RepID=A0A1X1R1H9_MYCBE|nr:type I polyketide synthase [Mycobacterium bohemicum]MCV6971318.1 type I polyketide synthase [Mycobacterium bohemicum]ORU97774.1 polyketide synthase [Mycobacterium bohemicum]CPR07641.1 polyketide synthase [Mycobacterium bohemicum DSM 44277]
MSAPADIALIGLACRFPAAAGPEEFWRLLRDGAEVTRPLDDVAAFDADFFNVSPREARAMDPRQRLALELAWEVLEDAFVVPATLRGRQVAVYLGAMTDDYALLTLRESADVLDHHSFPGVSRAMIANRISYALGLRGPSMTVDSGQSSSLVAVHLACEALRAGESELAIAGGVHLNAAPETDRLEDEFGARSGSGHTYAFDSRADGYVRSEGAGVVLLKPLTAALNDGDPIRAVIRGSAVGNAGHGAAGPTAPSVSGQADVIRRALASARLGGGDIDYVEAHGTGTPVGDPVEATALGEVFARGGDRPVVVGSVKTNIGHTGSAAGIAGLLKAVMSIENAVIPATLNHVEAAVDLTSLGLRVNTTPTPWPAGPRPRRAGVSSFGMGGTNAHVIVEEPPARPEPPEPQPMSGPAAWVVTARSPRALADQAGRLAKRLADNPEVGAQDVAWSLATTRTHFEQRAVLTGADRETLTARLAELASGQQNADVIVGRPRAAAKTVFVFPGQGSQRRGMGAELYGRFPAFARAFDEAAEALDEHLRVPLARVITDANALHSTEFAQPALFAVEVALAALLRHWGVLPDVVMGHSIGEITAAHVAGVLSLADAAALVAARGRLMAGLPAGGAMVAVAAGEAEVRPLLTEGVSVAAINGPNAVVISGAEAAVAALADSFQQRGRRVRRLAVSHAFHSALMEPMIDDFAAVAAELTAAEPRIALIENISGQVADDGYGSAKYWVEHVLAPVRFADGVRTAEALGAARFVEVGPGGGLSAAVEQSLTTQGPVSVVTLPKERPEPLSLLTAAGRLFVDGVGVDWRGVLGGGRRVSLPTYSFERQRFWVGARPEPEMGRAATGPTELAERLQRLEPDERRRELVGLVSAHAAAVLGHADRGAVDPERAFEDLGFDSLTGVELRDRLSVDTGVAVSRTAIFDYPTPAALAEHLGYQLLHPSREEADDDTIRSLLAKISVRELRRTGLLDQLMVLAGDSAGPPGDPSVSDDVIDSLGADALIALALNGDEPDDAR